MNETKIKGPVEMVSHYTYADYLNFDFDEMVEIIPEGKIFRNEPLHQVACARFPEICVE